MPGSAYITTADPNVLKEIAGRVANGMGFGVEQVGAWTLKVTQSSLTASLFLGAFVAYCDFTVNVIAQPDGTQHLVLERNNPWWTGFIGVNRVKNRSLDLANAYGNELVSHGVQILQRNDF